MKRLCLYVILNDDDKPFVLGCYENDLVEVMDHEQMDRIDAAMVDLWAPHTTSVKRHILVDIDEGKLADAFKNAVIEGEVV